MPTAEVTVRSPIPKSFRAAKVSGMFDVPLRQEQVLTFQADLSRCDREDWSVGAIVGSSGRGKSTLARALWPDASPPAWLRPYRVLSTGQQQRADLARALVEAEDLVVFDEFTSVVDRVVAKSTSVAIARHSRRTSTRFVAVTCHRDILPWLEADWFYDVDTAELTWGRLHRPPIRVTVHEGVRQAWDLFRGHHYLTGDLSPLARVFLAYAELGDEPPALVGFFSILPVMGLRGWWRGHRTVVLPDYQGLGIGNLMIESTAEQLWRRERKRFRAITAAPSLIAHRRRHPEMWRLAQGPSMKPTTGRAGYGGKSSAGRLTTSWIYLPEDLRHGR